MSDAEKAAETWLRDKYGAYRGHACWREIEAGYLAGYAAAMQWRGIESAPRDGTEIIILAPKEDVPVFTAAFIGHCFERTNCGRYAPLNDFYGDPEIEPTGWLPLPPSE